MAECLKKAIPSASYRPDGDLEAHCEPTEKSLEAFKRKIDLLFETEKRKKAATKEKKKAERFVKQQAWNHEVKRVQRYLGLREVRHAHVGVANTASKTLRNSGLGKYALLLLSHAYVLDLIPIRIYFPFKSPVTRP